MDFVFVCEYANPIKENTLDMSIFCGEGWEYILQKRDLQLSFPKCKVMKLAEKVLRTFTFSGARCLQLSVVIAYLR